MKCEEEEEDLSGKLANLCSKFRSFYGIGSLIYLMRLLGPLDLILINSAISFVDVLLDTVAVMFTYCFE